MLKLLLLLAAFAAIITAKGGARRRHKPLPIVADLKPHYTAEQVKHRLESFVRGAPAPPTPCPTNSRDDLLTCLSVIDANEDGTLTTSEINIWVAAHSYCLPNSYPEFFDGSIITSLCDADSSGNLTMSDWNDPAGCIVSRSRQFWLCQACNQCGLMGFLKK